MNESQKDLLTIREFADAVGVHYNTVRNMIKSGRLNAFRIGKGAKTSDFRIARSEIQRLALVDLEPIVNRLVEERLKEMKNERL